MSRNLEETLQAQYDSEIHLTITWLWDGGIDFAFVSTMEWHDFAEQSNHVDTVAELAEALHTAAMLEYPASGYAKKDPQ